VAEDRKRDHREVHLLFQSLQLLGGTLARCRQVACFVDHIDASFREQLDEIGVEARVVARVDGRCPYANKIRMLMEVDAGVDWIVGLDTDIAVGRQFLTSPGRRQRPRPASGASYPHDSSPSHHLSAHRWIRI
jgi:hypothetical protein